MKKGYCENSVSTQTALLVAYHIKTTPGHEKELACDL